MDEERKKVEIQETQVLNFNAVLEKDESKLDAILSKKSKDKEIFRETILDNEIKATVYKFKSEEYSQFKSIKVVKQSKGHLIDVLIIARLNEDFKNKIEEENAVKERFQIFHDLLESIQEFKENLPTLGSKEKDNIIFYLNLEEELGFVKPTNAEEILNENEKLFEKYGYVSLARDVALHKNRHMMWQHSPIHPWRRATILKLGDQILHPDNMPQSAFNYTSSTLKHFYRANYWAEYYNIQLDQHSENSYGYSEPQDIDFSDYLKRQRKNLQERREWIDLRTRGNQELSQLRRTLDNVVRIDEGERNTLETEVVLPKDVPKQGILFGMYDELQNRFDKIKSAQDKIDSDFDAISDFIEESTSLRDSKANYELQSEIRRLEYLFIFLAVMQILVGLFNSFSPTLTFLSALGVFLTLLILLSFHSISSDIL